MWIIVMFDLPVDTAKARRDYRLFVKALESDGFDRMQYSVFTRHCPSEENAVVHRKRVKNAVPSGGEVRVIQVTEKQFEKMEVYYGELRVLFVCPSDKGTLFDPLVNPPQPVPEPPKLSEERHLKQDKKPPTKPSALEMEISKKEKEVRIKRKKKDFVPPNQITFF